MANGEYPNPWSSQNSGQYPNLRGYLHPSLAGRSDQQVRTALALRDMDAEAMEGFLDDLGKFALKAAPTVLPLAGQVVGGIYGGPAGAAIGGSLGSLAGNAITGLAGGQPPARPAAPVSAPVAGSAAPMVSAPAAVPSPTAPASGSPAAGQLLQTILRPETL